MKTIKGRKVYTVSEINYFAKETLEQMTAWVEGEVSTFQTNPNWFYAFFSIKDESGILPCFVEPSKLANFADFAIGKKVNLYGVLTLFKKSEYKMKVFSLEDAGDGLFDKKFKQLYEKLKKEGLFDAKHKKPLPKYPQRVCLITSENSAGWNDFKTHSIDKFPSIDLISLNVKVEGLTAIPELLNALSNINESKYDVVVITRGGGSQEVLASVFNDEQVARAIFDLKVPKVVAIGHEINITLAELVADVRASTPTDAANTVVSGWQNVLVKLNMFSDRINTLRHRLIDFNLERLDYNYSRLLQFSTTLNVFEEKLNRFDHALKILSPQNTLDRGYSITYNKDGNIIRDVKVAVVGELIKVKLSQGQLSSRITQKTNGKE